jgi:DNA-binding NtrC family response regulator
MAVPETASAAGQGIEMAGHDAEDCEGVSIEAAPLQPQQHVAVLGPPSADSLPVLDAAGDVRPLDEIEADLIRFAIAHYRGQMSEVARRLRIGRSTLYRKLEGLGLGGDGAENAEDAVAAERQGRKIA